MSTVDSRPAPLPARTGSLPAPWRAEALRGAGAALPVLVGYLPFAMVIGVAVAAHPTPAAGLAATWLIFGGSAHLTVLELTGAGAPVVVAVVTGLLVNARLVVFSARLADDWRGTPLRQRAVAAAFVIDPTWALAEERRARRGTPAQRRAHYVGSGAVLWLGWSALVVAGMTLGSQVDAAVLRVLGPVCLIALVAPHLRRVPGAAGVLAAGCVAVLTAAWPAGTGLAAAMATGTAVAVWLESGRGRRDER